MKKVLSRDNLKFVLNFFLRLVKMKIVDSNESQSIASKELLEDLEIDTNVILDVGANVGQFSKKMATACPNSTIFSFEPNPSLHHLFESNLKGFDKVCLRKQGLGSVSGTLDLSIDDRNSLVSSFAYDHGMRTVSCDMTTIDEFLETNKISKVGLLKIDVEGFEIEVLKGCAKSFAAGMIDSVILEATFTPNRIKSSDAIELINYMRNFSYKPQGFYDLDYAHITKKGIFKLGNLLFVKADSHILI